MDTDGERIPPEEFERFRREYRDVIARAYDVPLLLVGPRRSRSRFRVWLARRRKYRYLRLLGYPRDEALEKARWHYS